MLVDHEEFQMKFKVTLVYFDIFSHQKTENGWLVSNIIPLSMKICKLIKWKKEIQKNIHFGKR